jgi:hypothetical protein
MKGDEVYGSWHDITDVNEAILMRLKHYFLTYKKGPNDTVNRVQIDGIYGREEAYEVIRRSQTDYQNKFLNPVTRTSRLTLVFIIISALVVVFFYKRYHVPPSIDIPAITLSNLNGRPVFLDSL